MGGRGEGGRRLEPAPLLKVKKLNKAKISSLGWKWARMVRKWGGTGRKVRRGDKPFGFAGCSADVHLAPIA